MSETSPPDPNLQDLRKFCVDLVASQLEPNEPCEFFDVINCAALLETYITTGQVPVFVADSADDVAGLTAH